MTKNDLFHVHEIETLSPVQKENVEPFVNEREALDFVNYYAGIVLNETRRALDA
jgi:hypothetical protein